MGILTQEMIKECLRDIGMTPDGSSMAYLRCEAVDLNLTDISSLASYVNLQHLDLSGNMLEDLRTPLGDLNSLRTLDASRNKIRLIRNSVPDTFALQELNLSRNMINAIPDMSRHKYLRILRLDNNQITTLSGLEGLTSLVELSLNDNSLCDVSGLPASVPVRRLLLARNEICTLVGVKAICRTLEELVLSNNELSVVEEVEHLSILTRLEIGSNRITSLDVLKNLSKLQNLRQLGIDGNPVFTGDGGLYNDSDDDTDSDIVIPDSSSPLKRRLSITADSSVLGPVIESDTSAISAHILNRYKVICQLPQLASLNDEPVTNKDKIKAQNVLSAADVESRTSLEHQFLNTAVTPIHC